MDRLSYELGAEILLYTLESPSLSTCLSLAQTCKAFYAIYNSERDRLLRVWLEASVSVHELTVAGVLYALQDENFDWETYTPHRTTSDGTLDTISLESTNDSNHILTRSSLPAFIKHFHSLEDQLKKGPIRAITFSTVDEDLLGVVKIQHKLRSIVVQMFETTRERRSLAKIQLGSPSVTLRIRPFQDPVQRWKFAIRIHMSFAINLKESQLKELPWRLYTNVEIDEDVDTPEPYWDSTADALRPSLLFSPL